MCIGRKTMISSSGRGICKS